MFETTVRVRYAETDKFGVVYHANYFLYFEAGRTEYLRTLGFPYCELEKKGVFLVVSDCECKYLAPATYDDELLVRTKITELTKTRVKFEYSAEKIGERRVLARGATTLACVDASGRPQPIPEELYRLLVSRIEQ